MKGEKGQMNIDFSETYDKENDIYYVTFGTGEPSYVKEVDDVLLLETGLFTNLPTGFRILNYSKHNVRSVHIIVQKVKKTIQNVKKHLPSELQNRELQIESALEKALI